MSAGVIRFEGQVRLPREAFDLQGFRAWAHSADFPQTGKVSFIAGGIEIDTSPEELNTHNAVKSDLYVDFGTLIRKTGIGRMYVDGALLINEDAGLATEPDFLLCAFESIRTGRVTCAPSTEDNGRVVEIRGTPDLVCEIVSNSSVRKDTVLLRKSYYDAGIPEYWLVDARVKSVKFQILTRGRSGYVAVKSHADGYLRSQVLQHDVRISRGKPHLGIQSYRLLSR
jgi:Uma2 family endonuclease